MALLVNPSASQLGVSNAVLWGRGRNQYHVAEFPGPLSVKACLRGTSEWRIGAKRFTVDCNSWLLINDRQPYSITIDSRHAVETFCVFFERGYVEDCYRSVTESDAALLDQPFQEQLPSLGFSECLHEGEDRVHRHLRGIHQAVLTGAATDSHLASLAATLVYQRAEVPALVARVPAVKASTREELYRRVLLGRQWLEENLYEPVRLSDTARAACLSPFHFQRLFKALLHESPQQYVSRRRMASAARLLRETDQPVTEISLETGHQSLGTFSTLFRGSFGLSPRAYRTEFARSKKFSSAT